MAIQRSPRLHGPLNNRVRAALYYARKRRLARLQGEGEDGGGFALPNKNWEFVVYAEGDEIINGEPNGDAYASNGVIHTSDAKDSYVGIPGSNNPYINQEVTFEVLFRMPNNPEGTFSRYADIFCDKRVNLTPGSTGGFRLIMSSRDLVVSMQPDGGSTFTPVEYRYSSFDEFTLIQVYHDGQGNFELYFNEELVDSGSDPSGDRDYLYNTGVGFFLNSENNEEYDMEFRYAGAYYGRPV